jgi:hypothetical protein
MTVCSCCKGVGQTVLATLRLVHLLSSELLRRHCVDRLIMSSDHCAGPQAHASNASLRITASLLQLRGQLGTGRAPLSDKTSGPGDAIGDAGDDSVSILAYNGEVYEGLPGLLPGASDGECLFKALSGPPGGQNESRVLLCSVFKYMSDTHAVSDQQHACRGCGVRRVRLWDRS